MSPRWVLVTVLASPMLLPRTSGLALRPEAQEPKAGQQNGELGRADFFVAPNGRDDNPGTRKQPFATLARARDAVRRLKADGGLKAGATVLVRGGTYRPDRARAVRPRGFRNEGTSRRLRRLPGGEADPQRRA